LVQNNGPHNFSAVPPGLFSGCVATHAPRAGNIQVRRCDGWVSMNFISTASLQEMIVSIDEHPLWVYEVDGRYVEPQLVDAFTLSHGSRISALVQLNKAAHNYTIRAAGSGLNQKVLGTGTLSYNEQSSGTYNSIPSINYAGQNTTANVRFLNGITVKPFPSVRPAQTVDQTVKLLLNRTLTAWQWTMNGNDTFPLTLEDIATPLLWDPKQIGDLTVSTKNNTWVDLIFVVTSKGGAQPPHPIHKHSTKAYLIGLGQGEFPWASVAEAMKTIPQAFNLENPPLRDTFSTLPAIANTTWMVVRYHVVNPGPFLLHCHINPHLTGGMALAILDGVDAWPKVPSQYELGRNGF